MKWSLIALAGLVCVPSLLRSPAPTLEPALVPTTPDPATEPASVVRPTELLITRSSVTEFLLPGASHESRSRMEGERVTAAPAADVEPEPAPDPWLRPDDLMLDPESSPERLQRWYAGRGIPDLVRTERRMQRVASALREQIQAPGEEWFKQLADQQEVFLTEQAWLTKEVARVHRLPLLTRTSETVAMLSSRLHGAGAERLAVELWNTKRVRTQYVADAVEARLAASDYESKYFSQGPT